MRISKGVLDSVTVNCMLLDSGEDMVVFMSCDTVLFKDNVLDLIRRKTAEICPEVPSKNIILNATHTHTSPSHYPEKDEIFAPHDGIEIASSDEYADFMTTEAAKAIKEAYDNRAEGGIAYGYGYAVVGQSRRMLFLDDVSQRPGSDNNSSFTINGRVRKGAETNDDYFSGYEAGADHFLNIMFSFDKNEKLTGAIINVPCPSQSSEMEYYISADYWHNVRETLKAKYGNITIVSQCAAAGDLAPRIGHYQKARDRRYRLKYSDVKMDNRLDCPHDMYDRYDNAERICEGFDEVLSWAEKDILTEVPIKSSIKQTALSKRIITDEEYAHCVKNLKPLMEENFADTGDKQEDFKNNSMLIIKRVRFQNVIDRYEKQKTSDKLSVELCTVRVGDIAFATNPFELFMDYQHRIQGRSPFIQTFVVQLCAQPGNLGFINSYLPTERAAEGLGYGAEMFSCTVSPQGGQELVDTTIKMLNEIKD